MHDLGNWALKTRADHNNNAGRDGRIEKANGGSPIAGLDIANPDTATVATSGEPSPRGPSRHRNDHIATSLRHAYDAALNEDVPSSLTDLLQQLR